jgi:hypothetical protein
MRRQIVFAAVLILMTSMAVPALGGQEAPAAAEAAATSVNAPVQMGACTVAAAQTSVSNFDWEALAPSAVACAPSPLCATPGACDADCRSRGARLGACTSAQCCICIWKI